MFLLAAHETACRMPPWVLDVGLSLSPTGLYWALGLAREAQLWLPQCHWSIIDDKEFPLDERLAAYLTGMSEHSEASGVVAHVRSEWREARERIGLESTPNIYWPMDGRSDSVVPKDGDHTLVDRVHILATGLDSRLSVQAEHHSSADALSDCARDTLALAAALSDRRPIILSRLGERDSAPVLVTHLETAGIPCCRLAGQRFLEPLQATVIPAILASGLAIPVANGRIRLAGIFLVVPGSIRAGALAELNLTEDDFEWNAGTNVPEAALWNDAAACWWEVV